MSAPFQVMPPLTAEEYATLKADIAEHGIVVPVVMDGDRIVDGHHRVRIAGELGITDYPTEPAGRERQFDDSELRDLAWRLNAHRRQLTQQQIRDGLTASLRADPNLSDRQHARRVGASPTTVGRIRREQEQMGTVSRLDTRRGADGVNQPAVKPSTKPQRTQAFLATPEGAEAIRAMSQPTRRKPLPDAWKDAAYDTRKAVERLHRLAVDDRFPQHRNTLAGYSAAELGRISVLLEEIRTRLGDVT